MKRLILLAAAAILASCAHEEQSPQAVTSAPGLHASIENDGQTKTVLDENNNVLWSAEDQIVAFMKYSLGTRYQIESGYEGKTSAYFYKISSSSSDKLGAGTELDHVVAYYPYAESVYIARSGSNYQIDVTLPAEQSYAADSFGNGASPMLAVSEDYDLNFRNVCGALRLKFKGTQRVKSVMIEGKNGEKLSGEATLTAYTDGKVPAIVMDREASTSVVLNCGSGVKLDTETVTEFIIALPPVTFSKGFIVTVTDVQNNVETIQTNNSYTVSRNVVLNMGVQTLKTVGGDYEEGDYMDADGINHGAGVNIDGVIWAPVNVGASSNTDYGDYFVWYDAHHACPEGWRMPSISELQKLGKNSTFAIVDGVNGRWLSGSSVSTNPKYAIFMPSAGDKNGNIQHGYCGAYWSMNSKSNARGSVYFMEFTQAESPKISSYIYTSQPLPVRCVRVQASEASASEKTIDGLTWSTKNVGATTPSESGNYYLYSNATEICPEGWRLPSREDFRALSQNYSERSALDGVEGYWLSGSKANSDSSNGIFMPLAGYQYMSNEDGTQISDSGGYYFTSTEVQYDHLHFLLDNNGVRLQFTNNTSRATPVRCVKGTYDGPEIVDTPGTNSTSIMIDGMKWSSRNVGAGSIEEYGNTYTWETAKYVCPEGWRLPTKMEMASVIEHSSWEAVDGVYGLMCAGSEPSIYNTSSIFLPATTAASKEGTYWTSSTNASGKPQALTFINCTVGSESATSKCAVRCVQDVEVPDDTPSGSGGTYTLTLDSWAMSTSVDNPNSNLYDGVYESTNRRDSSVGVMYIDIDGYEKFTLYVRCNTGDEADYDYMMISNLDQDITSSTDYKTVKAHTKGASSSGYLISNYTKIEYEGIDKGKHRIEIIYRKDDSDNGGANRGYVLIPKNQ